MPSVRNKELVIHLRKTKGENIGIRVQQSKSAPPNYEIKKLNENGAAAKDSSLREGDFITAVNGKSIRGMNKDAVMLLLKQCAEMTRVTFDVIRKDVTEAESPVASKPQSALKKTDSSLKKGGMSPATSTSNIDADSPKVMQSAMKGGSQDGKDGSLKPKRTVRSVSIVVPRERRSKEMLYEPDDIILLDSAKRSADSGSTKDEEKLFCPIQLPPEISPQRLAHKSMSLVPEGHSLLSTSEGRTKFKSLGDIEFPSMKKRAKPVAIHNYRSGKILEDRLINDKIMKNPSGCDTDKCVGSHIFPTKARGPELLYKGETLKNAAEDFIEQYYSFINRTHSTEHSTRLDQVLTSIDETGSYELTMAELEFGAKLAWRNAPRCINRIVWNSLHMLDCRKVITTKGMFQALLEHLKFGTNEGNLRSCITVFRQRTKPGHDFRIWNDQLIRYAGYEREKPDKTRQIIGDPASIEFTKLCMRLGWRPPDNKFGQFDILPLVLQAAGGEPEWFSIPEDLILEVRLTHPEYDWFEDFDLKWYALPAVANMMLEIGGLQFPACPFNGWYMSSEIGARNLCDSYRYNMLKPVAQKMGLDTKQDRSLWKDRALVEVNIAVLSSFQKAHVTIVDHHSASEIFMQHLENEYRTRGGCPTDWVWVVPPISGSTVETFHQELLQYHLSPSYEYQVPPYKNYKFKDNIEKETGPTRTGTIKLKSVVNMIILSKHLFTDVALKKRYKSVVLYATETGRSRNYAGIVNDMFSHAFDSREMCMEDYNVANLPQEHLVLVVTSTFGSGDPPANGEAFGQALYESLHPTSLAPRTSHRISTVLSPRVENVSLTKPKPLTNVKFSVFGLGSRAFPNFCTFAHSVDKYFEELGGYRFYPCGEGDELCGQEESFRSWCKSAYLEACKEFDVSPNLNSEDADKMLAAGKAHSYEKGRFRSIPWDKPPVEQDICTSLSKVHKKPAYAAVLKSRKNLQSKESNRSTILCVLESPEVYSPGDHLAIYPENDSALVEVILKRLNPSPGPDEPIVIEYRTDTAQEEWEQDNRLPVPLTLREALTHYLDITSPPTPQFLSFLAMQTNRETDREQLQTLAEGGTEYEDWKYSCFPNLLDVIEQFPSLQKMDVCLLLTALPLLQTRYYSISSSPLKSPNEIHITVAVVSFMKKVLTRDGRGAVHHGVCSNWLNTIPIGKTVPCAVREARNFHMPDDPKTPMVLIGPGTGIAPFRSFWQQREHHIEELQTASTPTHAIVIPEDEFARASARKPSTLTINPEADEDDGSFSKRSASDVGELHAIARRAAKNRKKVYGKTILYFGCRNSHMDHIYKEELDKAKMSGALDNVHVAFSRDKEVMEKTYVQDMLKKNADEVVQLLMESQAHFYVCGDISMASDVFRTIENIMVDNAAMSSSEAREYMEKMKENGQYHEDIFGVTLRTAEVTQQKRTAAKRAWTILVSAMDGPNNQLPPALRQDSTDGGHVASVKAAERSRRTSLVRRPTVTVLVSGAGTPMTPGTPQARFSQPWPTKPMRRKPSEPIRTFTNTDLEIPAHHALIQASSEVEPPSSLLLRNGDET